MPYTILNRFDACVIDAQPQVHEFGRVDPDRVTISFSKEDGGRIERTYRLGYTNREVSQPVHGKHYFLTRLIIPDERLSEYLPEDSDLLQYMSQFPRAVVATEPLFRIAKRKRLKFGLTILQADDPDRRTLAAIRIGFETSELVAGAHKVSFMPV